jgi:hypothetical protein
MIQANPYESPDIANRPNVKPLEGWKKAFIRGVIVAVSAFVLVQLAHLTRRMVSPALAEKVIESGVYMTVLFVIGLCYAALALAWGGIELIAKRRRSN